MKNGKYEGNDFPLIQFPGCDEVAEQANTLIPQLLEQLVGDGDGFTDEDFWESGEMSGVISMEGRCHAARIANTKLQALRAKDAALLEGAGQTLARMEVENRRLREQLEAEQKEVKRCKDAYLMAAKEKWYAVDERNKAEKELSRLTREREEAPVVYGAVTESGGVLFGNRVTGDYTHQARLIDIQPISIPNNDSVK